MLSIKAYPIVPIGKKSTRKSQDFSHKDMLPTISLETAQASYFIHQDRIYRVESAPAAIFKAAFPWPGEEDDLIMRWWVLNKLVDAGCPLKLYTSREEVEQSILI